MFDFVTKTYLQSKDLKVAKKDLLTVFEVYQFYIYVVWRFELTNLNTKIKDGFVSIDYFIGQLIKLKYKSLTSMLFVFMQFANVMVVRRLYIFNPLLIKFYILKKLVISDIKKKKKKRFFIFKHFRVLNWLQ